MIPKSDIEMERAKIIKVSRTLIRLKHSLAADKELNDILPGQLDEFDIALQHGELKSVHAGLLKEIAES
jgi:hypothetical protein